MCRSSRRAGGEPRRSVCHLRHHLDTNPSQRVCGYERVFVCPMGTTHRSHFTTRVINTWSHCPDWSTPRSQRDFSLLARRILALFPSFPFLFCLGDYSSPFFLIDIRAPTPLGSAEPPCTPHTPRCPPPLHPGVNTVMIGLATLGNPPLGSPMAASEVPSLGRGSLNEFSPGSIPYKTPLTQYPPHLLA